MTRKRILNLTSRKKRDNMVTISNVDLTARPGAAPTQRPAVMSGGSLFTGAGPYMFLFCANARDNTLSIGGPAGTVSDEPTRTATTTYARGLKEAIEINTNTGMPWQWRRIVFMIKGLDALLSQQTGTASFVYEDSNGYRRPVIEVLGNKRGQLTSAMFDGTLGVDWSDYFGAKTDSTRISVKYDKTRTIASGNEEGMIRRYNMWHPVNQNIVYDDDETGGRESNSLFSTLGKPGAGDMYVVDMFQPRAGATGADQLIFNASATYYWHEK